MGRAGRNSDTMRYGLFDPDIVKWEVLNESELWTYYHFVFTKPDGQIHRRVDHPGAPLQPALGVWPREDSDFLRENYIEMDDETLANKLGKTMRQVKSKRAQLGLLKGCYVNSTRMGT